jgi:hypothetical protein
MSVLTAVEDQVLLRLCLCDSLVADQLCLRVLLLVVRCMRVSLTSKEACFTYPCTCGVQRRRSQCTCGEVKRRLARDAKDIPNGAELGELRARRRIQGSGRQHPDVAVLELDGGRPVAHGHQAAEARKGSAGR